ncbi:MAG: hypothetical protein WCH13_03220 [Deltaproteobacteria bacterium]
MSRSIDPGTRYQLHVHSWKNGAAASPAAITPSKSDLARHNCACDSMIADGWLRSDWRAFRWIAATTQA